MSFDFHAAVQAPFRMQPGLRRLPAGATHLTPAHRGCRHLAEKLEVLRRWPHQALVSRAGFDALPALRALAGEAAAEHPTAFARDGDSIVSTVLGWRVRGDTVEPVGTDPLAEAGDVLKALPASWRAAALLALAFEEDFAIVEGDTATIPWLAVCLPSHWAPEDKAGRHFAQVHAPVADNALLLVAGERLLKLVTGPDRWERFVWTIAGHSRLHAHPQRVARDAGFAAALATATGDVAERCFWRTERQTFLPVAHAQQAIFTIHVQVQPLAEAIDSPERARRLHAAVASMSPAVLAYRGLTTLREPLLAWLESRA